jgi:uncharacterized protein involved in exopolysaccharide biosynthesis
MGSSVLPNPPASIELSELISATRRLWWLVLLIGVLCTAIATVVAFSLTPIYRVEVLVTAADDDTKGGLAQLVGGLGGVAAMAGIDVGGKSNVEVSLATLSSQRFTSAFIQDYGLLPDLFPTKWDRERSQWISNDPSEVPTIFEAVREFDKGVRSVSRDRRTGLIRVAIEWKDREKAAKWANELINRVNETARRQAIEESTRSIEYLNKELAKTTVVGMQQAIHRLIEVQVNKIMLANVRQEYAFKVIDPAVAPDAKFKVRPKRLYIMIFGAFIGGMLGIVAVLARVMLSRNRA